ncbi:uncharacterized protein Z520_08179 [Fonsecaea multimorphosa CBS 102226]|uniref:YbhB/YbcL family Raf kinase inhibitor-like protein n=1 Tax=Fonsecaea multimorphosa CBS 102226 TaxID=1442371 RepID=A0A0D2JZE3_9EURO|nr:uncharacterized protein Z520_08179 [Fonsecaea multimorphosa CBS 102226]KIX95924.1 hypothetical protein Z520_08179 [Fonsecaea multimorphosa CBS 102226]OAL21695.1 hypothetical protein AYO22_07637 [Fonsecaea multimorphosa]
MGFFRYFEYFLARLLYSHKGRDAKLLTRQPIFATVPKLVQVTSPTLGGSPAHLSTEYSAYGESVFPDLSWSLDEPTTKGVEVKEWLLIIEDPDAPIPIVPIHGLYYAIPATKTSVSPHDFNLDTSRSPSLESPGPKWLTGNFRLGKNWRGTLYSGPRPPVGHGEHRYFFQVIALTDSLDTHKMKPVATRDELLREMQGKICGWGEWIGIYEQKW